MTIPATPPVNPIAAIKQAASAKGLDWRPLASVAQYESGLNPRAVGDGGHAFGLFQNNNAGGTITGDPNPQRFFDPNVSAQYTTHAVSKLGLQGLTPEQQIHEIVYRYERPADPGKEYAAALANYRTRFGGQPGAALSAAAPAAPVRSGPDQQPSLTALPQASLAPFQQQFSLGQAQNQRALDALGAISGKSVQAAPAPDFSALLQALPTPLQPTMPATAPTKPQPHVVVPLNGKIPTSIGPQAQKVVELAHKYLGTKYVFGGAKPGGFDCSGLVQFIGKQIGVNLPRTAAEQFGAGKPVTRAQLQPGDPIFFRNETGIHHEGLYIGNDQFIQAPHTGDHVKISSLSDPYYAQQFAGGRRVF